MNQVKMQHVRELCDENGCRLVPATAVMALKEAADNVCWLKPSYSWFHDTDCGADD